MPTMESNISTLAAPERTQYEPSPHNRLVRPESASNPHILILSPFPEDHEVLHNILNNVCRISDAHTCREAVSFLCLDYARVIFCEGHLPDGSWKDMLSYIAELAEPPALIVTSRLADERLWAEVLNEGGHDVLAKPFREQEVRHVLANALGQTTRVDERALVARAAGFE